MILDVETPRSEFAVTAICRQASTSWARAFMRSRRLIRAAWATRPGPGLGRRPASPPPPRTTAAIPANSPGAARPAGSRLLEHQHKAVDHGPEQVVVLALLQDGVEPLPPGLGLVECRGPLERAQVKVELHCVIRAWFASDRRGPPSPLLALKSSKRLRSRASRSSRSRSSFGRQPLPESQRPGSVVRKRVSARDGRRGEQLAAAAAQDWAAGPGGRRRSPGCGPPQTR